MKSTNCLVAISGIIFASQVLAGDIKVSEAWARATAPGQENGSIGLMITSQQDAHIISVSSPLSESAELHTMSMDNGIMKMRQLNDLFIPAKKTITLGPGGNHLMLFGLKRPLKTGESIPLNLTIKVGKNRIEKIKVLALIRPLDSTF